MKLVLLCLLVISACAHHSKRDDSYLIRTDINYNSKKIESFEMLVNDSEEAEMTESDLDKKYTTTIKVKPKATRVKGVDGIKININLKHKSSEHGIIESSQEVFVESGIEADFSTENQGDVLKVKLMAARTVQKGEDPKICMATIYEAQREYKKNNNEFADKLELIKHRIDCPKGSKITLTRFHQSAFMAIGSFNNEIWVINEKRYMVKGLK